MHTNRINWPLTVGVLIIILVLIFSFHYFSPRERYKRAFDSRNWGTAKRIIQEMNEEDRKWAQKYTEEHAWDIVGNAIGNAIENLF